MTEEGNCLIEMKQSDEQIKIIRKKGSGRILTTGTEDKESTETSSTPKSEVRDEAGGELRSDRTDVRSSLNSGSETGTARIN